MDVAKIWAMGQANLIILVDGVERRRKMLKAGLVRCGFKVIAASGKEQTLEVLQGRRPRAFILDMDLPEQEGHRLLTILKGDKRFHRAPVLVMVELSSRRDLREIKRLGADLFAPKPVRISQIVNGLNRALGAKVGEAPAGLKSKVQKRTSSTEFKEVPSLKAARSPGAFPRAEPGSQGTILVIDDEVRQLRPVRLALIRAGYDVITARNGVEGMERLKKARPDVILLDLQMPRMDGWQFLELKQKVLEIKEIPVIVLTGLADYQTMTESYERGSDLFLNKPVSLEDLFQAIQRVRRKRRKKKKPPSTPGKAGKTGKGLFRS